MGAFIAAHVHGDTSPLQLLVFRRWATSMFFVFVHSLRPIIKYFDPLSNE